MASSKKTLDIDSLSFQTLYIKAQSGLQISSYMIPVIPGDNTVIKKLEYLTPQQALSVGNIYITPSTIPDILNSISTLSTNQRSLADSVSSLSTMVGYDISSIQSTTNLFFSSAYGYTYGPAYSNLTTSYTIVQAQNIDTLNLQGVVLNLGDTFSSISSQYSPDFSTLGLTLETTYNQGPAVSTLSTYFSEYFDGLAESIPAYSTQVYTSISTAVGQDASSMIAYTNNIEILVAQVTGPGVSTLSTIYISSLISYYEILSSYDTSVSISSLSTNIDNSLSNFSTQFSINSGIPGICSMSTYISSQYGYDLANLQLIAGSPGISTMSTTFTSSIIGIGQYVDDLRSAATICTFSTILQTQVNNINNVICTVGFTYTILQQQLVKDSLSTLSTSFGNNYNNVASLSSFSSFIPSIYSTLSTLFDIQGPLSTVSNISTFDGSNTSTIINFITSTYPEIYSGPGLSSLSTSIGPNFSTISTSLQPTFISFCNSVENISSVRADPGVCTLSTFFYTSTNLYASSYTVLYTCTNTISASNTYLVNELSNLSTYDSVTYSNLNPADAIAMLVGEIDLLNLTILDGIDPIVENVCTLSSIIQSTNIYLVSSYIGVQSTSVHITNELISSYNSIASTVQSNLYYPVFSSFTTDLLTTASLTVTNAITVSSIGINQTPSLDYPFTMAGGAKITTTPPLINHIMLGVPNINNRTVFTSSNASGTWASNISNQYSPGQGNAAAYSGRMWVTVGSGGLGVSLIKYTNNISRPLSNSTYPNVNNTLTSMNTVKWNGSYWLAGGSGDPSQDPTLLTSPDGITWSDALANIELTSYNDLSWNGYQWVVVGSNPNSSNILYTDATGAWNNGINPFSIQGNAVTTNGRTWVAVGEGTITTKYSYDGMNWQDVVGPQLSTANTVVWNGNQFLAGGSNGNNSNLIYSYDGINWSYVPVLTDPNTYIVEEVTSLLWDGTLWSAAGINDNTNTGVHMISYDSMNWSTIKLSGGTRPLVTSIINGHAYASNSIPSIQLSNFDIYSGETPAIMNTRNRMNIIQSTIYFNDGDLTIRHITSTIAISYTGINTTYPQYALDIGLGDARKPSGTTWLTVSDARVKSNIISADLISCAKLVSDIPLRQYSFTSEFQKKTGTSSNSQYGFIAQEVKAVLPGAISYTKEYGLDDFHSLDTDQIFKLEFGATQYLLQKIEAMEVQVSTLEAKYKKGL